MNPNRKLDPNAPAEIATPPSIVAAGQKQQEKFTWEPLHHVATVPVMRKRGSLEEKVYDKEVWTNGLYQVSAHPATGRAFRKDSTILTIRPLDGSTRHDWREFQEIKNQLVGPEWEAVEVYPAESRLCDSANGYMLFCNPRVDYGLNGPRTIENTETNGGLPQRVRDDVKALSAQ